MREHRGAGHVAAALSAGFGPVGRNVLPELWVAMPLGSYTSTRGWPGEAVQGAVDRLTARGLLSGQTLSQAGRAAREEVEARTDAQEQSVVDALGPRLDDVCARLDARGERCVQAGAVPADVLKRAAD